MQKCYNIKLPSNDFNKLKVGDKIILSGNIYTLRDTANKKIVELISKNKKLPFDLKNQIIFYAAPTKTPQNKIIGSIGPTTSQRFDKFTIPLLKAGVKAIIGKGERNKLIVDAFKKYKAIYFILFGGVAAFLSQFVKRNVILAFAELKTEAVRMIYVENLPLIVGIDTYGNTLWNNI